MLKQVANGVLIHVSDFMESNSVVVHGGEGVLLVDPGIRVDELAGIAGDLREAELRVSAGFSTHPHWDHLLWNADFGDPPRYGTARGAAAIAARLADQNWKAFVTRMLPPDIADEVPLDDLFGRIAGLPADAVRIPWDGPEVRIVEHQGHAHGHAALLIPERGVLIAGDMLSDVLVPLLNLMAPDPLEDYLAALELLEGASDGVQVVIPGHGSVGDADELRARVERDRAYVQALRDGSEVVDPRVGASAKPGWEWVAGLHERQRQQLTER